MINKSLLILLFLSPLVAFGGGTSFQILIKEFEAKGNDEFVIIFEQFSEDNGTPGAYKPRHKTVHLRYAPSEFKWGVPGMLTKDAYLEGINQLLEDYKQNEISYFGIMGSGLIEIESNVSEWQSNGLKIYEESEGKSVVYSFAQSI